MENEISELEKLSKECSELMKAKRERSNLSVDKILKKIPSCLKSKYSIIEQYLFVN